jgi:hypothetical protein
MSETIESIRPYFIHRFCSPKYAWDAYRKTLPKNGNYIIITWFPDNRGETNAYIGMEGYVSEMKSDGTFILLCKSCVLICGSGNFHYQIIEPKFILKDADNE